MQPPSRLYCFSAEIVVENDFDAMLAANVKDGTGRDRLSQHFFQTEGLGAQLDFVIVPAPFLSPFEVDGIRDQDISVGGMEFD